VGNSQEFVRGLVGNVAVAVFRQHRKQLGAVLDGERKASGANGQLSLAVRPARSNLSAHICSFNETNGYLRLPLPSLSA